MGKYTQGYFDLQNPQKYMGKGTPVFRSSWESTVMRMFDTNPSIISWASEPIKIPYKNPFTGKYTVYVPDFIVVYKDVNGVQHSEIIEVKPEKETFMEKAKSAKAKAAVVLNSFKWAAAKEFADKNGFTFRILNESNIFNNPKGKS